MEKKQTNPKTNPFHPIKFISPAPKNRNEVIKELDKLDKLSENEVRKNLKKYGAEKLIGIFKKDEKFFEKYESYTEIKELKKSMS